MVEKLCRLFDKDFKYCYYIKVFVRTIFKLVGLRSVVPQHSISEAALLKKYAEGCKMIVEIGVAEGASALLLRSVASSQGKIYLIDPYLTGRFGIAYSKLIAKKHVNSCKNAKVFWINDYSYNAAKYWVEQIDFLFIDGDHAYDVCLGDWTDWSKFVKVGGIAAFHDGRIFDWTNPDAGSVKVVNELFRYKDNPSWKIIDEIESLVIVRRIK